MDKALLRKELLKKRRAMSEREIADKSQAIFERLRDLPEYKRAGAVLAYSAFDNEVQTDGIIEDLKARKAWIYLPVITSETEFMPCKMTQDMQKNRYGIEEPMPIETAPKGSGKIDLVICPGVGFDFSGYRLGYGKGYYDRFLSGEKLFKIGLAFEAQMVKMLAAEETDIPMDCVITEKAVYRACA
ncbi:MAG: 5-formyltetrahydrofolate cyclo-ligase [Eubacteriales bacterium]